VSVKSAHLQYTATCIFSFYFSNKVFLSFYISDLNAIYTVSMSLSGYATFLFIYFTSVLAPVPAGTEV